MNKLLWTFKEWAISIQIHKYTPILALNMAVRGNLRTHQSPREVFVEGNLGIRGMALFFSTHECNPICTRLNLTSFDLSTEERERQVQQHACSPSYASAIPAQTACRGSEEPLNGMARFGSLLRRLRSQSSVSEDESDGYVSEASSITAATAQLLDHGSSIPKQTQFMTTFSEDNIPLSSSFTAKIRIPTLSTSVSMISASPVSVLLA